MLNIAEKMKELIPLLHQGLKDVELPDVKTECESEWSPDYAIVCDVYHCEDGEYFDESAFYFDLKKFILKHFTAEGEQTVLCNFTSRPSLIYPPGTIIVSYDEFRHAKEIEVYRIKEK